MAILQKTGITGSLSISSSGIRPTTSASLFNVNGYNGRLLSVVDTLSGSLFSVNSIAGLPILEVFSNNRVVAGKYAANDFVISGSRVGIGTNSPSAKLAVAGAGTGLMLVGNSGFTGNFTAITLNNGTATTSYNLLSSPTDTTLYINRPSGGNINFREANSDQMTLLSGGLLGIGTTAPSYQLEVYKTTNDAIARVRTTAAGAYLFLDSATDGYFGTRLAANGTEKWFLGGYGTSDLQIKRGTAYDGTEVVRVTTVGNVGIGTSSPSALLHISGAAATTAVALFQGYVGIGTTSVNFPLQIRRPGGVGSLAVNVDNYLGASTRDVLLKVNPDTVGDTGGFLFRSYNGADVNAMAILATGNIGIGTTSPDVRLDVFAGTLSSTANSTLNIATFRSLVSNASYLKIIEKRSSAGGGDWTTAATRIQKTIDSTDQAYIDFNPVGASYGIAFGTGATTPTQKMVINIDGNVGIGISSPTSKLHAVETTKTGSRIQLTTNTTDALMNANATNDLLILNAPYNANPASVSNAGAKWGIKFVGSLESNQINTNNKTSAIYAVSEDTGLGYNRGTSLAFYTNQFNDATYAERMRIFHNGNVGIGTTSPVSPLHVFNTAATLATFTRDLATDVGFNIGADSNGTVLSTAGAHAIQIYTNSTEKVRINSDGNVGIGTTSPSALLNIRASAPTSTGTVTTGTNLLIDSNTSNYITFRNTGDNATYAGLTFLDNNTGGYVVFRNYASNDVIAGSDCMIYGTYQDHIFQNGTSETINAKPETMRIKQNGSVGIGANSPNAKLHISSSTTTNLRIETKLNSGTDVGAEFVGPNTHSYTLGIDTSDSNKFKISYAASRTPPNLGTNDRFVIQTDGKIGIGTSVAETDLSIVDMNLGRVGIGTVTYYGVWLTGGTSATDYSFLSSPSDTNLYVNAPSTKGIYNQINNVNRFIITTDFVRINNSAAGADGEEFQRWSYISTDNYYLKLIQTVTAGVVRYNFCMVNNATAYNNVLVLDRGNVGIGTVGAGSPAALEAKLDVLGTVKISDDTGIGAVNDGTSRLYVQGATLTEPFLSVQTCLGNNSTSTATYNTLKGYLAVKIGNNVGTAGNLITAGTYYLRLWGT